MRKMLMSGAAFLTSSVTQTGEEIESLAPDESLKDMEKQLSLLERYLNELPDKLLAWRPHGAGAHPVCDRQQTDCDDPAFFQTGDGAFQRVGGSGAVSGLLD